MHQCADKPVQFGELGSGSGGERISELDSLRGLLALGVLTFHLFPQELFWLSSCVDGFFVISGFVITRLLLAMPMTISNVKRFYLHRALRIWPIYYLTMLIALSMHLVYITKKGLPQEAIEGVAQSLVFVQFTQFYWRPYSEYVSYNFIRWFGHSWSLAVEEQFYWLWPMVLMLGRSRPKVLGLTCVALIATGIWSRNSGHLVFLLATRVDGLALGACIAIFKHQIKFDENWNNTHLPWWVSGLCVSATVAIIILLTLYIIPNYRLPKVLYLQQQDATWIVLLYAATFASLVASIILLHGSRWLAFMRHKGLLWLGARSYAIYMFHPPIQGVVERVAERLSLPILVSAAFTIVLTVFAAHGSFLLIESRFARIRHQYPLLDPGKTHASRSCARRS